MLSGVVREQKALNKGALDVLEARSQNILVFGFRALGLRGVLSFVWALWSSLSLLSGKRSQVGYQCKMSCKAWQTPQLPEPSVWQLPRMNGGGGHPWLDGPPFWETHTNLLAWDSYPEMKAAAKRQ